jgi:hypothetical protein
VSAVQFRLRPQKVTPQTKAGFFILNVKDVEAL